MDSSRKTAFDVLLHIEKEKAYSNLALNLFIKDNKPENPAFTRELVYGVLENKLLLDYYLDNLIPSGIRKVKKKEACILRLGLYQIIFMDSVPAYAAVSRSVDMAKKLCRGREGFINGVLRDYMRKDIALPEEKMKFLSVKYSFPMWIIDLWREEYGEEICQRLLEASNGRPQLSVRVNRLKADRADLARILTEKGFEVSEGKFSGRTLHVRGTGLLELEEYERGLFSVQDEASTLAADMLGAGPGETVIDVCAAPGGKTAAIGEMMDNRGKITAFDIYEHKLRIIEEQARRLGIDIAETDLTDGATGKDSLNGVADKVLADVPCSGLGVIRRKPEIKYKEPEDLQTLYRLQGRILERSAKYLKPGGTLVYSTCTINRKENGAQTADFLSRHPEFEKSEERQFLPTENIDGFYICKMIKKG